MKILVPSDGAELSEQAAVLAIELLAQHPLEISLLRVVTDAKHARAAADSLDAVAARLEGSPAAVSGRVAIGQPAEQIVQCADQLGADLIAMSTHGRPLLARMLLGSVTDRVIRTSPVPVLVLHPPTMSIDRLSPPAGRRLRVLAPLDGSAFAEEAVQMMVSLLRPSLVDVTLVGVQESPEEVVPTTQDLLEDAASRLRARDVPTSTMLLLGDAAVEIARAGIEHGFDVIAMSTHGRGMLSRVLVGSITDRVTRISEVPVLVIQPASMETPFDPVSGDDIDPEKAVYSSTYHGRTFFFTSFEHKATFDGAPEAYVGQRTARVGRMPSPYEGFAREPSYLPPPIER